MEIIKKIPIIITIVIGAISTNLSFFANAEELPQVDVDAAQRKVDSFIREQLEEKLVVPAEKAIEITKEESEEASGIKFFVEMIDLLGVESFSPEEFKSTIEKYEKKEVALEELKVLTRAIEREYLEKGIIAACFLPPQEIRDGVVILQVVEAKMGRLEIQNHKYFNNDRPYYYWKVYPGETLRYDKLSKSLQMMNKNPDREVKATLVAGKQPGTTDVVLIPKTSFPLHLTSTFDREGSVSTGESRVGWGLRHNNFFGIDDSFIYGHIFGTDFSSVYAYHSLPVTADGATLMYGFSQSVSIPKKEFSGYGVKSKADNFSVSLYQDIYRKDERVGELSIGFEAKDKTVKQKAGIANRDRLRILSLGADYIQKGFGSSTAYSLDIYQGIEAFGANSNGSSLASRGADPTFTKVNFSAQHAKLLPFNLKTNLKIGTMLSSTKLTPQQQFGLGGINSVRGYPADDYLADSTVVSSAELLIPGLFIPKSWRLPYAKEPLRDQVTSVLFADYGHGERRGATVDEEKSVDFLGVGAGVRVSFFDQALMRLEWGFPVGDDTITRKTHSRLHFSVDFQERLPGEIERIRKMVEEENIKQWAWQILYEALNQADSPLRAKLGDFKQRKELNEKVMQLGLYRQIEEYVRSCVSKQKQLNEQRRLALTYYKEGKVEEAKALWQEIINKAEVEPLSLEF